ncbi:hypothetical protein RND81_06G139500 [Saponaria officinalis]|uniref:DUF4283 domain-containing protein n=1 Tax=Saponaria officinalis TaxID=3572 RepID=A0AAW1KB39_SAPOF
MEDILSTSDQLFLQYFCKLYPWNPFQFCDSRRIWLEIIGVPPQCWCRETFEKTAQLWGDLVCLDTLILKMENLMVGKVLLHN